MSNYIDQIRVKGEDFTLRDSEAIRTVNNKAPDENGNINVSDKGNSNVIAYGAKGDGVADDTAAFQAALAENRLVYVPEGTYNLSNTLFINENCEFELAQSAVLNFTQTDKNCIEMPSLANIKGNHATIFVPYKFNAHVIHASTDCDDAAPDACPPFTRWDPQWKKSRYITDLNICKRDHRGFCYSVDGDCYGTAIYINCNESDDISYMWGVSMSGLRIAGGFNYGLRIYNEGDPNAAWNHDMRVEAVIDACKIGVSVENCRYARLAVTVQPRRALATDGETYTPYAGHGIELIDSKGIDLSSSRVWDWNATNTLWSVGNEYQHIALRGECRGLILDDFLYYEQSGHDIRDLIYTDTPSNLEQMTILQEPFTRWFKPIDGEPYFSDGYADKKLAMQADLDAHFITDVVPTFTNLLPVAVDTDGTIYNDIGYKEGVYMNPYYPPTFTNISYIVTTGLIPCKPGSRIRASEFSFENYDGYCRVLFYDANREPIEASGYTASVAAEKIVANSGTGNGEFTKDYVATADGFEFTIGGAATVANTAYIRFCVRTIDIGANPVITVDEEITYTTEGFLADGIKVKAENVIGGTSGGNAVEPLVGATDEITPSQVYAAISEGRDTVIAYIDNKFSTLVFNSFNAVPALDLVFSSSIVQYSGVYGLLELIGNTDTDTWELVKTQVATIDDVLVPTIGTTAEVAPSAVKELMDAGKPFAITHSDSTYGEMLFNNFVYSQAVGGIISSTTFERLGVRFCAQLVGNPSDNTWSFSAFELLSANSIPTTLPNPSAITFTDGALYNATYDGSEPITVRIPIVPSSMKNPHALTVNDATYDGSAAVNLTDTINRMIDAKLAEIPDASGVSF